MTINIVIKLGCYWQTAHVEIANDVVIYATLNDSRILPYNIISRNEESFIMEPFKNESDS